MPDTRVALVTGANQGVGRHVAQDLAANGLTVLVGSRNFERCAAAAMEIGSGAIPIQLDVTDPRSRLGFPHGPNLNTYAFTPGSL